MRIILFNSEKDWGGGEKWYHDVANLLAGNAHEVFLFCHPEGRLAQKKFNPKVKIHPIKVTNLSFFNGPKIFKLRDRFKNLAADCIIMNLPADMKIAAVAAKLAGIKQVVYRRGSSKPVSANPLNTLLFRKFLTKVLANSLATKRTILANDPGLIPEDKISVVYNGIDLSDYLEPQEITQTKIKMVTAGRLSPEKGHERLLKVAKIIQEKGVDFELQIAGQGPLENELRQKIKNLGLDDCVRLVGFVEPLHEFLQTAHLFLLSSHYEGFGYVLIEAMAAGLPCVTFDIETSAEIIDHGRNGFIAKNSSEESFANFCIDLIQNEELRRKFAEQARIAVKERFTLDIMYQNLMKALSETT